MRARGQFDDFIEEQRAAIGPLETPHARLLGTGVGAFFHAEQFGFDQVGRDGGAVQRDKGPAGPFAAQVQAAGDHFLAHAGLAQQQHRGLAQGHLVDQCAGPAVHRRLADAVELAGFNLQALAHVGHLHLQRLQFIDDRVALEVTHDLFGVVPLLGGLADDPAMRVAATAATDLLVDDLPAEEKRAVADGITEQHPAHRLIGVEVLGPAVFHFKGVLPFDIGVELAVLQIDVDGLRGAR